MVFNLFIQNNNYSTIILILIFILFCDMNFQIISNHM
jgi:hypothetical protein